MPRLAVKNPSLTAQQVKALKKADSICFRYQRHNKFDDKVSSVIDATIKTKGYQVGTEHSETIPVEVNCVIVDHDSKTPLATIQKHRDDLRCFTSLDYQRDHGSIWSTITANLKAGDKITLVWNRNNNCESIEAFGMACDELSLTVTRTLPSGKKKQFTYKIDSSVTPRHSSARMIRYGDHVGGGYDYKFSSRCWLAADYQAPMLPQYS